MEIRSRYNAGAREGWKSSVPSMTQQQFKDEADINYIVSMYDSSGVMPTFHGDGQPAQPVFGDFASLPDNAQEMYNRMIEAKNNFDNLITCLWKFASVLIMTLPLFWNLLTIRKI